MTAARPSVSRRLGPLRLGGALEGEGEGEEGEEGEGEGWEGEPTRAVLAGGSLEGTGEGEGEGGASLPSGADAL